jgi:hypothetical protein
VTEEPAAGRFTVDEANALLPELRTALAAIKRARQDVLAGGRRVRQAAPKNGGGEPGRTYWTALERLRTEVERLNSLGVVLRDPEAGLVDFPAVRDGEDGYLCWRVEEEQVGFWHGTGTGFAGRRPL